jgi:hypothetical protein
MWLEGGVNAAAGAPRPVARGGKPAGGILNRLFNLLGGLTYV